MRLSPNEFRRLHFLVFFASVIALSGWLPAQQLPTGINLGATSFLDGGPPAGPGLYYQQYAAYYHSSVFMGSDGNPSPALDYKSLDGYASVNQFIYMSGQKVIGSGQWGLDVIVPIIGYDLDAGSSLLRGTGSGLGDIHASVLLQFDPIMGEKGPLFVHRFEFQTILPTGKYDRTDSLNPGDNVFALDPYWAGTAWITPALSVTWGAHYLWSDENDEPTVPLYRAAQAGSAVHINFSACYEIVPNRFRVGFNGYWLQQLDNSEGDGREIPGSKERTFAIGPGLMYSFSQEDHLFLNAYFEMNTRNRPEGNRFVLHYTHHF
jgi:hypothetical protein